MDPKEKAELLGVHFKKKFSEVLSAEALQQPISRKKRRKKKGGRYTKKKGDGGIGNTMKPMPRSQASITKTTKRGEKGKR